MKKIEGPYLKHHKNKPSAGEYINAMKSIVNPEKDLIRGVRAYLDLLEWQGICLWWERLQSGKAQKGPYYIQLCREGTSDYVAIIRKKTGGIEVIFIECKTIGGTVRDSQKAFAQKMENKEFITYMIIENIDTLKTYVRNMALYTGREFNLEAGKIDDIKI